MGGWIKLHRSLMKHWLFSFEDPDKALAWIDMLMSTNYKPGKVRRNGVLIDLERGELGQSANGLSERWGWSRGKVIRFLEELERDKMIVQHKDKRRGKISICNYESYQSACVEDESTGGTTDNTTDDTTGGQQADDTKEVNNNKNEKKLPYAAVLSVYNEEMFDLVQHRKFPEKAKTKFKNIIKDDDRFEDPEAWRQFFRDVRKIPGKIEHLTSGEYGTLELIVRKFDTYYDQVMTLQKRGQL